MKIYKYTDDDLNRIYGKHRRYDVGTYLKSKDFYEKFKLIFSHKSTKI